MALIFKRSPLFWKLFPFRAEAAGAFSGSGRFDFFRSLDFQVALIFLGFNLFGLGVRVRNAFSGSGGG